MDIAEYWHMMVKLRDTCATRQRQSPNFRKWVHHADSRLRSLLGAKLRDAVSEAGYLAAGRIAVNDALLSAPHDDGFSLLESRKRFAMIARRNRLLDLAYATAKRGAAAFIDLGPASDLASSLAGGTGIGHGVWLLSEVGRAAAHRFN